MDKDNRDDFTFAKLSDLKLPVTFRMLETFPDIAKI
jgi:phosphatidylinositol 3-kinase